MQNFFCRECIAAEPLFSFLIWAGGLIFATLYCLHLTYRSFKKARMIEDMPTSLIRSASQGFTELVGVARVNSEMQIGPLTGTPCLWWNYSIEKYQSSGKSSSWVTIESGTSDAPFHIQDSTGLCQVLPSYADISTRHKYRWQGRHRRPSSAPKKEQKRSLATLLNMDISIGKRYRYTERLLKEGDPLYVLGHFESDSSGQRTITVEKLAGNILRSWKQDFAKLLEEYDHNDDGQLDIAEWQAVQEMAKKTALDQQTTGATQPALHQIGKPVENGLPFLIGSEEQSSLSKRYRLKASGFGAGFLAIGAAASWYLSARGF